MRHLDRATWRAVLLAGLALPLPMVLGAQGTPRQIPLKYAGPATVPAITAGDLRTRLYAFSDDSMLGRAVGTASHLKATEYLEREAKRLGLQPAGDNGSYFQELPVFARAFDLASTVTVGGTLFRGGVDFLAASSGANIGAPRQLEHADAVYGGLVFDTTAVLPVADVQGKVLVLHTGPPPTGSRQTFLTSNGFRQWSAMLAAATAVMTIDGDQIPASAVRGATQPSGVIWRSDSTTAVSYGITTRLAEAIFHGPLASIAKGATGRIDATDVRFVDTPRPARNVVAMLSGSDAVLRGEYVVVGAPNDHLPPFGRVEHDSLRIVNTVTRPQGALSPPIRPSEAQARAIAGLIDTVRKLRAPRVDSIYNGADDGGSGAVASLEIAEAMVGESFHPKRSVLFVWFAGEESGLRGAEYFTEHAPVSMDSVVAEINLNALARGEASDVTGVTAAGAPLFGNSRYLAVVGSRRQSSEFGDLIPAANTEAKLGLDLSYALDAPGNPLALVCRSDQLHFARLGIPVAYLTTGGNRDFHQVTDEAQYVQFDHFAAVTRLAEAVVMKVADLDHRPVSDQPKPDPQARCKQ